MRPSPGAHRGYFKLGLFCFAMWTVVAAYLVVWVKSILKVEEEWEEYAPKSIPFATCLGLVGIISCARACSRRNARPRAAFSSATRQWCTYVRACARLLSSRRFIISFWPVWGFLSLPIVFILFMGMLHLAHFVPL